MAEGLRAFKRRQTRRRIECAAVTIAYDEGVAAVTVDRVCRIAAVARSTFFNYFPTLEQAVFGSPLTYAPALTERILTRHGHDLVTAACRIVMESLVGDPDDELAHRRFALFVREPGTTRAVAWAAHQSRESLVDVITSWLDGHPDRARVPGVDHVTEARLVVGLAVALGDEVQRHAREVGDRVVVPEEAYVLARRQMAAVGTLTGALD